MATKRWIGTAADVAEVDTITVSGVFDTADTITLSIGGGSLTITIVTGTPTTTVVASIIAAAINADSATDGTVDSETRTLGGQEIPEMTEIVATSDAAVVTLTGNTAGIPFAGPDFAGGYGASFPDGFTIAVSVLGSGAVAEVMATEATGRNWFDNAENWSTGTVPANNDVFVWSNSDIDCLFGMDTGGAITGLEYQIDASYTGKIGLAARNPAGYEEWRPRFLDYQLAAGAGDESTVRIGDGDGPGSSRINIDLHDTAAPNVVVLKSDSPESGARVAVSFVGGIANTEIVVNRGIVGFCEDGTTTGICNLIMGYVSSRTSDAQVFVGRQGDVQNVTKTGGILNMAQNDAQEIDIFTQEPGESGETTIDGEADVLVMNVNGGTMNYNSTGLVGALHLGGTGFFDLSHDNRPKSFTSVIERNSEDSVFHDPNKVATVGGGSLAMDYNNVNPAKTSDDIGQHVRITRSTPA